jgi:regulator of replication initiation timing
MGAEMNEREALKLALEALDCICSPLHVREITKVGNAMKAIKEALSQPEQESDDLTIAYMSGFHDGKNKDASQRTWVGLTEEDKNDCLVSADPCECLAKPESHQLMEDVEAKLKEKNCG